MRGKLTVIKFVVVKSCEFWTSKFHVENYWLCTTVIRMPSQITNDRACELQTRYGYLLKPIRDLLKNWEVDIAAELEEYLNDVSIKLQSNSLNSASVLIHKSYKIYNYRG